jgi:hypothetical protein
VLEEKRRIGGEKWKRGRKRIEKERERGKKRREAEKEET